MADKIKKFFQKKKVDAKFKMAGPGHKLSDNSMKSDSSSNQSVDRPVKLRTGLSEESQVAADAALARLTQKRVNPSFNTSLSAIQAQVKRELEASQSTASMASKLQAKSETKVEEQDLPKNLVATGVFFKCPMISEEVLSRDEWRRNIKSFLYEQLDEERGLTACLMIHSCNYNKEKVATCIETLCKYLENIIQNPTEEKYHKIRMSNRVFQDRVQPIEGAMDLLLAAGFTQQSLPNNEGVNEDYLVYDIQSASFDILESLIDALRSAEPIQLVLDRNLQVLLPSQAATKVQLPQSFYALTPEELKREQLARAEEIERSQMLRTKAMREKDELREMRKYKYAVIRVRFPDGILLQGTFSVYEKYLEIYEFVQTNLEHGDLPFYLVTPTGSKLTMEEHGINTLIDLRLVPAVILNFAWDVSVVDEINRSPNKDVFLKPEVMVLVKEID